MTEHDQPTDAGTTARLTRLPHSGLHVPDPTIRVTRLAQLPTFDGVAFQAVLRRGKTQIGTITNDGYGGSTDFHPQPSQPFGYDEIDAFAAACRNRAGQPCSTEAVLNDLVDEYDTGRIVAKYTRQGRISVRLLAPTVAGSTDLYTSEIGSVPAPSTDPAHHAGIAAEVTSRRHAAADEVWQVWTGDTWHDLPTSPGDQHGH